MGPPAVTQQRVRGGVTQVGKRTGLLGSQPQGIKIDLKKIESKNPDLFAALQKDFGVKPKPYRRFTVKLKEEEESDDNE